jgi:hypothetical protein
MQDVIINFLWTNMKIEKQLKNIIALMQNVSKQRRYC